MLLKGRNAIVYGGGGGIGGAMARAFAREGATVHLAGRTGATLATVAEDIRSAGGAAETAELDALDEAAVDAHADAVAERFGGVDVSVNLISIGDVQGTPLAEMAVADFLQPIMNLSRSVFLTARAAARHMIRQGSGVIIMFGGDGDPMQDWNLGGLQVALAAQESFRRQLAAEVGRHGVRVLSLRTGGIPETIPGDHPDARDLRDSLVAPTMLQRAATLADVGNVAVFAASDLSRSMTATALNISCGTIVD